MSGRRKRLAYVLGVIACAVALIFVVGTVGYISILAGSTPMWGCC